MYYQDTVYGQINIGDPVLIELMETKAMRRLHNILQHGITGFLGITHPVTRFEHSVGTMILARHFKASLQEQIAALIHDVSHTAFSHVTDHVFGTPTGESYHEVMKESYLKNSDIPKTLANHGFDWRDFIDDTKYPILEQSAPALCADRIDYFFRDSLSLGILSHEEVEYILSHLLIVNNQIVADDIIAARVLADRYMSADEKSWSDLQAIGLYELMARIIRRGVDINLISEMDVWQTDIELWNQLKATSDSSLKRQISELSAALRFEENLIDPLFEVTPRIRTIDPMVLVHGQLIPLSSSDPAYKSLRDDYLRRKQKTLSLRIVRC